MGKLVDFHDWNQIWRSSYLEIKVNYIILDKSLWINWKLAYFSRIVKKLK